MAGLLKKGMSWLGLGPEEDYEDDRYLDDVEEEPMPVRRPRRVPAAHVEPEWDDVEPAGVRVLPSAAGAPAPRPQPTAEAPRPRGVVRTLPASATAKPHVVSPKSFNDAQEVGDWFRRRQPVIVNLQGLDRDLARRLLDFASGVAYGLGGSVERVASHVYLLTPADVEVSADDRRRLRDGELVDGLTS